MMFTYFLNCLTTAGIDYMTDITKPREMNLFISKSDYQSKAFRDAIYGDGFSLVFASGNTALFGTVSGRYITVYQM